MAKKPAPSGPEEIQGVNMSQFSIARFYGGIKYNGQGYTYFPENGGTLIRDDVLKARAKETKKPVKPKPKGPMCSENGLLGFTNEEIESLTQPKG